MKIDIMGGHVEIKEFVNRKTSREYLDILGNNSTIKEDGGMAITAKAVNAASEYLVLAMISKIVMEDSQGKGTEIIPTAEWLDEIREQDFTAIGEVVQAMFTEAREKSKK